MMCKEISLLLDELNEKDKENKQLKSRIARLGHGLSKLDEAVRQVQAEEMERSSIQIERNLAHDVLSESPQQSLAAIQADAVETFKKWLIEKFVDEVGINNEWDVTIFHSDIDDYLTQLRQQSESNANS